MDVSAIICKKLLKVFVLCLCIVCYNVARVEAGNGLGLSPEMQTVRAWFEQKRQSLGVRHPTADEKRQIEAAKKEWNEKSKTMTDDEYQEAYEAWDDSLEAAWAKLSPSTSSDADVIAADSADYINNEIDAYARGLEGQVKKNDKDDTEGDGAEPDKFEDLPIEDSPTSTPTTATTGTAETPASSDAGQTITPEPPANITQTVTHNENGNITQETTSNSLQSTGKGAGTGTDLKGVADEDDKVKAEDSPADNKAKEDDKKKEEEKEEIKYTGVYKDRQLIPDAMAVHCEMNAEDVVKDMSRLEGCMRKYITEMHNDNASEASEGKQAYNVLRFNVLSDALKKGIAKAAAVNGYESAMNNYAEASANTETKFDSEANISNTLAFATDVQNSIRDIYVESLRMEAINGFGEVDPSSFVDDKKSEKAKSVEDSEKSSDSDVTNVDTSVGIGGEEDEDIVDGEELSDTVVTGNANAKEYINKFRAMSDSRLAQQRTQYESILNDPTASEEMKKEAENMLRYVEYIEEERNGSAETAPEPQNSTPPATENQTTQPTQTTPKTEPVDESDPVARDLMGRSDADLNSLYQDVQRDQDELSTTIFKMKQIKEKWQKQNKWTEKDEKQLNQQIAEYKDMQEYQKSIEKELKRRGK